jgi:hypothetical protein
LIAIGLIKKSFKKNQKNLLTVSTVGENVSLNMNQEKLARLNNWFHSYEHEQGSTVIEVKSAKIGRLA